MTLTVSEDYARHIAYRLNSDSAEAVDLLAWQDEHAQESAKEIERLSQDLIEYLEDKDELDN